MGTIELLRADALALPNLAKFAVAMAIVVGIPPLSRRVGLPAVVGLLLVGVVAGPHCLGLFGENRPIGDLFADLGKLLLMFFAGLEMDLALFQRTRHKAITLGFASAVIPMVLGTVLCLCLGYEPIPVIVVGSLLGSHTLLASPIVNALGVNRLEPVAIAVGATLFSDSLSLIIFAICVSTYKSGFSISAVALQIIELIVFVPLIFFTLSRGGAFVLSKAQDQEDAYFILMLGIMALAGVLAQSINLPGIVGAFLAGLSVNAAVRDQPAKTKLKFFGDSFFIPIFFMVTGFLIDPRVFARSALDNFSLVAGIIAAVVAGKWMAAAIVSRAFGYTHAACLTIWSLTLPQVAATLAATLVGFETFNAAGQRMIDQQMLNAVLILMVSTSIAGPILTEHFAPRMLKESTRASLG